jgi:cyclic-di-AMP phosphodiesterase PgpH
VSTQLPVFQKFIHTHWYRWLLLTIVSAVLASALMPRQEPFPYRYTIGQPWHYHTLYAPFDFDVLRPDNEARVLTDKVMAEHGPYALERADIAREQIQNIARILEKQRSISRDDVQFEDLVAKPGAYLNLARRLLGRVYDIGLMDEVLTEKLRENPATPIYTWDGKTEKRLDANQLLTLERAHNFLTDSLPFSDLQSPEVLFPLLEKALVPNIIYSDSLTEATRRAKLAAAMSAGILVRKGDEIVQQNALVNTEIAQKLTSLSRRYATPPAWAAWLGYGLFALLVFGLYYHWLRVNQPATWAQRDHWLPLLASVPVYIGIVSFLSKIGMAVLLLAGLPVLALLLLPLYSLRISLITCGLAGLLVAFALSWGTTWAAIQIIGLVGIWAMHYNAATFQERLTAAAGVAALQITVCAAAQLAGNLPDTLIWSETVIFILLANALSLSAFFAGQMWMERDKSQKL